jgi:probable selenium-dependent hydroxylase accessory protein YqeC
VIVRTGSLSKALDLRKGAFVAFVGGGGKTTAILRIASELRAEGLSVLVSTTTKVGPSIAAAVPSVELACSGIGDTAIAAALASHGAVFVAAGRDPSGKYRGVEPSLLDRLAGEGVADVILVEADGARQKPLKAPAAHEPVVPSRSNIVVPMVGLDALGRTIDGEGVHRPEIVAALSRADRVTPEVIVRIVTSREGGLKSVPPEALVRPILNKVRPDSSNTAIEIASVLLAESGGAIDRVVIADILTGVFSFLARSSD